MLSGIVDNTDKQNTFIRSVGQWYEDLVGHLDPSKGQQGYCFSSFTQSYIYMPAWVRGDSKISVDAYASLSEMKALVSLVGPQGVRVIENRLLKTVRKQVEVIKIFLEKNQKALRELKDGL